MSGPFGSSQWMYSSGEAESQSLRFNDDDSAYLSWTPASAGNRKTWTWSGWVKRGNLGGYRTLFGAGTSGTDRAQIFFWGASGNIDALMFYYNNGTTYGSFSVPIYRDTSSWYHVVLSVDTTQATASERAKFYVNGEAVSTTSYTAGGGYVPLNTDLPINNSSVAHRIGSAPYAIGDLLDGYLSEVNFVDGTALDPTSFGEADANGKWVPIIAPNVTYGTNGFYLPFTNDYEVEGFNVVTYRGNGGTQYIGGVGFEPDFVWIKDRSATNDHKLFDRVRGVQLSLASSSTAAEATQALSLQSFDPDGFSIKNTGAINTSGNSYVAWAWDMGTGSVASNTDGSITSSVKASTTYGQSIVSYTGTGSAATIGHGLSSAPEMLIVKNRDSGSQEWAVYHTGLTSAGYTLELQSTVAEASNSAVWNSTSPTASVFSVGASGRSNGSSNDMIAYCFHSVSGYSDFGSYTGTGASGNSVTTGFKPAFVMIKCADTARNWRIYDATRMPAASDPAPLLYPNLSNAEATSSNGITEFTDTGFVVDGSGGDTNASGDTYIYMAFADKREAAFWLDQSGNNNDWTNNNMQESDISLDSPTNNFATWNAVNNNTTLTLAQGNLRTATPATTASYFAQGSFAIPSGKFYFEGLTLTRGTGSCRFGVSSGNSVSSSDIAIYNATGQYEIEGTTTTGKATYAVGDVIGCAVDTDANTIEFFKNNASQGSVSISSTEWTPHLRLYANVLVEFITNFGQDSSFAGNKVAQGNQDANGKGDFYYEPPSGYLALCTDNLPAPAIADGSEYFNTVLWSGNGGARSITGVGFEPDLVWLKTRSGNSDNHRWWDTVRGYGATKDLYSNSSQAESSSNSAQYGYVSTNTADGFDIADGSDASYEDALNYSGWTYVAWNWKANGTGVSNTDGSITSTVSANTTAGFSIVSYTGDGTAGATVGHGLDDAPDMVMLKSRTQSGTQWPVYHSANTSAPETDNLFLNLTNATSDSNIYWNDTAPTSTVFSLGTAQNVNNSGQDFIAYCFHNVEGYSKFGSYTGNGSTDGTFVYTGFRPAFVMVKSATSSLGSWMILDSVRDPDNVAEKYLHPNLSSAEGTTDLLDFTSNGFKWRYSGASGNSGSVDYIYMAFAETPFKYSNAR